MPRQYVVDNQFNEKERMTQSFYVQLHSRSLLSHLSNKGNFGARVLFELCYIKARRKFSNEGNIEIQRHHEAAICFIRYV